MKPTTGMHEGSAETTEHLIDRARRSLAYGSFDWIVRRPLYANDDALFPIFAAEASGCEIVDTAGQRLIDWANSWGCNLLGYRHPAVEDAIRQQLGAGPLLSLTHPIEIDAAELLTTLVPGAERVAFCKTGTDAMAGAIRVARAATGREIVLQHGLLNFQAWHASRATSISGTAAAPSVIGFDYNDLDQLEELFDRYDGRIAAILMEPLREELPQEGYLEGVRHIASSRGAILIVDEIVTGFRLARGGAQEAYGVTADLVCLGKAIANGMPLAALVSRRELMRLVTAVSFDSTFRSETLSLAAAAATLRVVRDEPVAEQIARAGASLRHAFETACKDLGVAATLRGPAARMSVFFEASESHSSADLGNLFLQQCMRFGVFTTGHFLASYAHDSPALRESAESITRALAAVADVLATERARDRRIAQYACQSWGYLNIVPESAERALSVWGWMLLAVRAPDEIEIVASDGSRVLAEPVSRPELSELSPRVANADEGGYKATLPADPFAPDGIWFFVISAKLDSVVEFRCHVRQRCRACFPGEPRSTSDGILWF